MAPDPAAEATRLLAQIRRLTARADRLLIQLKDSGASWADIAALIDPDRPDARSSAQRRIESARRRLTAANTSTKPAGKGLNMNDMCDWCRQGHPCPGLPPCRPQ